MARPDTPLTLGEFRREVRHFFPKVTCRAYDPAVARDEGFLYWAELWVPRRPELKVTIQYCRGASAYFWVVTARFTPYHELREEGPHIYVAMGHIRRRWVEVRYALRKRAFFSDVLFYPWQLMGEE